MVGLGNPTMPTTVLLADDHAIVRQGLRALLEREGFEVVGQASNGREAVDAADATGAAVALLDFAMPVLNGLDAARAIARGRSGTRPILLTMHPEAPYVLAALRAGVRGYLLKSQAATDLFQAIRDVARGLIYLSPTISQAVVQAYLAKSDLPSDPLSGREREVLQLVAEGNTSKEIAQRLGVSVKTAEAHRGRLMDKLAIHDTASLVRYAVRQGVVQP
jgi:DNA-binding NarL/FixJ family response regulator